MERLSITPRSDWQHQVESLGFNYHTMGGEVFWDENACYHFDAREMDELASATNDIEKMCIAVVDQVVRQARYTELNIPESAWQLIESSWNRGDKNLCGRLDFRYNGTQPPKLLEYNGDTPVLLPETSIVQRQWREQVRPNSYQFNTLHEKLVAAWPNFGPGPIHLACQKGDPEVLYNITYLADTIRQAGFTPKCQFIENILWNDRIFVDADNQEIKTLFKLYPWNWMLKGAYGTYSDLATLQFIEPIWKMILSNKGMMVLLWEMFPGHPNLLPSFFDHRRCTGEFVKKPLVGRGGKNISLCSDKDYIISTNAIKKVPAMFQQFYCPPSFEGNYPVICSWLIAGESAGIGIREDLKPIGDFDSRFVPHFVD